MGEHRGREARKASAKRAVGDGSSSALESLLAAFTRTLSRAEAARLVLDHGVPMLGAVAGAVELASRDGGELERIASRGAFAHEGDGATCPFGLDALEAGEPVWRAADGAAGAGRAWVYLPLLADGAVFGALSLAFEGPGALTPTERAWLRGFAQICAQALDRARLFDEERAARERNLRLMRVTAAFSRALTPAEVGNVGVALGVEALGAAGGALAVRLDGEDALVLVGAIGTTEAPPARLPLSADSPVALAVREERAVFLETEAECRAHDPFGYGTGTPGARAALPLALSGRVVGALCFGFGGFRRFSDTDRAYMVALAHQCGQALERARLYEAARAAEEASRRTAARMKALAELGELFAEATTDYARLLESMARNIAACIGDACAIFLASDDGTFFELAGAAAVDPDLDAALRAATPSGEVPLSTMPTFGSILRTGQVVFVPSLDDPRFAATTTPDNMERLARLGVRSLIAAPLRARGRVLGVLGLGRRGSAAYDASDVTLARDIADRAALAIDNARLYAQATDAVRVRDDFLSVAGHELKTPLTALLLQMHSLQRSARDPAAPPKLAERATKAIQSGQRLATLIDELLDVSRVSAGRLSLELDDVDLAAVTRECVARWSDELARVDCEARLSAPPKVQGRWDRARCEQIVSNLLTNAMKYGRGKPIEIELAGSEETATLRVRDHGIGIAPEDHARIFDRFERAVSTRHFGGLGLGLWIVRQIVEAHGGAIRVESERGHGATFCVDLPRVATPTAPRPSALPPPPR